MAHCTSVYVLATICKHFDPEVYMTPPGACTAHTCMCPHTHSLFTTSAVCSSHVLSVCAIPIKPLQQRHAIELNKVSECTLTVVRYELVATFVSC